MLRIRHESRTTSAPFAPTAPRLNPRPLPDIRMTSSPIATSPPSMTPRPPTSHRHRRYGSNDECGYSSSLESSTPPRGRPTSQAVRTSLTPSPPLKGILKTGNSESSVVFRASLIQQDRDGYASSPEKTRPLRTSQPPNSLLSKSRPSHLANSATVSHTKKHVPQAPSCPTDPRKPPATLHWKLLPFDAQRSRGKLRFDFAHEVDEIVLAEARQGPRPLTVHERNKPAAEPGLTEMVIYCTELPGWPVYVARQSGIRCVDVFEAIRDTYNVVLTATERTIHQSRVRDIERRRPPSPEGTKNCVRRGDLLEGKTLFLGLDWRTSDSQYPDGCWCLKVGSPSP